MTETEELEELLSAELIGKAVAVTVRYRNGTQRVEVGMVERLAIDTVTKPEGIAILFLSTGKRCEVPLDDFKTFVKIY